jgi:RNA polymerase sigma factor (sigma-70 family)
MKMPNVNTQLVEKFRATGDKQYLNELLERNKRLVWKEVWKYSPVTDLLEPDDLFQIGSMGFLKAVEKFDTTKGILLSTYATFWIRNFILEALNKHDKQIKVSEERALLVSKMLKLKEQYEQEYATDEGLHTYLMQTLRIKEKVLHELLTIATYWNAGELDAEQQYPVISNNASAVIAQDNADITEKNEHSKMIQFLLDRLDDHQREVIHGRFFDVDHTGAGQSRQKIADEMGLTQGQVQRLEKQALLKMRTILQNEMGLDLKSIIGQ